MRQSKLITETVAKAIPQDVRFIFVLTNVLLMSTFSLEQAFTTSKYYRGGFDSKINRREAGLILGISPSASKTKIKEAHKRIMLLNHPDRGTLILIIS